MAITVASLGDASDTNYNITKDDTQPFGVCKLNWLSDFICTDQLIQEAHGVIFVG